MTLLLTKWEVEELREALRARGRLWQEVSPERFIRHTHNQQKNLYEVHLKNGQPRGMYLLSSQGNLEDRDLQLLAESLTSLNQRVVIEKLLKNSGVIDFTTVAHKVCEITIGNGVVEELPQAVITEELTEAPKRSRYLENLLRRK